MREFLIKIRPIFYKYTEEVIWDYGWEPAHWRPRPWTIWAYCIIGLGLMVLLQYV